MDLQYKNINIHYSDSGKGTALVLLHGFLENSTMWKPFISKLSKKNRIITIDLLGHGKTGCLGYIHSMEDMAEAVKAVLSKLRLRRIILVGHSMGGYVSLAFAEKYPDMIKGLCLMNSTSKPDSEEKKNNRDRAIEAVKQQNKMFVGVAVSMLFKPENLNVFTNDVEAVKKEALKTPLQGVIAALEGMKIRKDRTEVFQKGNFKKLLIVGKHDPVIKYDDMVDLVENTDIEFVEFLDGHMSHIENKKEFSLEIMHFIEKI